MGVEAHVVTLCHVGEIPCVWYFQEFLLFGVREVMFLVKHAASRAIEPLSSPATTACPLQSPGLLSLSTRTAKTLVIAIKALLNSGQEVSGLLPLTFIPNTRWMPGCQMSGEGNVGSLGRLS